MDAMQLQGSAAFPRRFLRWLSGVQKPEYQSLPHFQTAFPKKGECKWGLHVCYTQGKQVFPFQPVFLYLVGEANAFLR